MATVNLKQISIGLVNYQSGDGSPDHIASTGDFYVDTLTGNFYQYKNSIWNPIVGNGNIVGNLIVTGTTNVESLSASTLYSGSTNLYDIFLTTNDGNDITRVQNGWNTYTGGTGNNPTINISGLTINNINVSGNSLFNSMSATTFSGETIIGNIFSGGTFYGDGSNLIGIGNALTVTLDWKFSTNTSNADPGNGKFRYNNSIPSAITQIYISDYTFNSVDVGNLLDKIKSGMDLYIQQKDDSSKAILFTITSSTVDNSGWHTIPVSYVSDNGGGVPINNKEALFITFSSPTIDSNTCVTGFTYNNANILTIKQNDSQPDLSVIINVMSGLTVNGNLSGTTIFSGNTDVSNLFSSQSVTNLINNQLTTKANLSGSTFTGTINAPILSATTLSGGTIISGSTDISNLFGGLTTQQSILNQLPTKANLSGATFTGNIVVPSLTATTSISGTSISGGTILSGSTNIDLIFTHQSGYLFQKAGSVVGTAFAGNPKTAAITFTTPFPNNNYAITITGESSRAWSIDSKTASGFTINANANGAFTNNVFWIAIQIGEGTK